MSEGRRQAILIASSEFPDDSSLQTLRCPKNDVEGLAEALTSPEFGLFSDPQIFVNETHHKTLSAINRLFAKADRQDQILIYYSGHGKQDAAGHLHLATLDTETDALETTSIAVGMFRRLIDNYACKRVALILDCCFSGAVGKDFLKSNADGKLQQTFQDRGIYILTASTATQTAREKEGDRYSLFTKYILQGICQGEADRDDDGLVSMSDLYEYVRSRVPNEAPQYPTKWEFGIQGHELIIARAAKIYGAERLRAFREKIKSVDDYLLPEVFDQAIKVIRDNQAKRDKEFFNLLEVLVDERATISEFSARWLKTARMHEPEAQVKQPPSHTVSAASSIRQKEPDSFADDLNGVELEMILVPSGSFKMGSAEGKSDDRERPQRDVAVPSFYMGKYQITQAQWQAVIGKNPSNFKGDKNLPVENVSWDDAKEFCRKISEMTAKAYRLPSEAEWEYACRAGTTGDYAGELDAMGWYDKNSGGKTQSVGQKQANTFGLYDMHGNVWEWCEDVWHDSYKDAPTDGSAWLSGGDSSLRVLRGGSWGYNGGYCRSAYRLRYGAGGRNYDFGFRVVISARTR